MIKNKNKKNVNNLSLKKNIEPKEELKEIKINVSYRFVFLSLIIIYIFVSLGFFLVNFIYFGIK